MKQALKLLAICCAGAAAHADEGISTDRPDFVESSTVVGTGRWQVETGVSFQRDGEGGLRSRSLTTPTLLRYGLNATTELRLETEGYTRARTADAEGEATRSSGFSDMSLGMKWHVHDGDAEAGKPSTAWLLHVDLPTGAKPLRGHGARPSLRAVAEWDLPHDFSLGVMPGVQTDTDEAGRRFASGLFAATLGKDFYGRVHAFVELAAQQLASRAHGGNIVTFDTGFAVRLGDDWQWDLSLQKGLSAVAPDLQVGLGLSARF